MAADEPVSNETKAPMTATVTYNDPRDPFESFNRSMWHFNYQILDQYLYRPVSHGYKEHVPSPVKTGISNFVHNLEEPASLVNNTLQGKFGWAANAGGRFIVNSTIGLLGLIDVADMMGMPRKQDSFNEVLGFYGVPDGPYLMVPVLGPYSTRKITTDWVDDLYFPLSELTLIQSAMKWGLKNLDARAQAIDQERLVDNALDPYTFVKDAYFQHMSYRVYDGNVQKNQDDDELLNEYLQELD
ncbi:VacJ family lipoprotein [Shewanella sp. NIFS-20-20]|uniref:MlaA family lipoprotein n=1 Tax=Shewanella sp. NIFS-20-20 TaxID=2853806 RepID=UPI001C486DFD|nr:VacJ family lipoprotein [Shewanella sp. NIFS-20-20]MBV7314819.1 VacJ family lipoprotein [Shewanella sp. NIFS-20-20]